MRPLLVLLLVIIAIGALIFGVLNLGQDTTTVESPPAPVAPVEHKAPAPADLVASGTPSKGRETPPVAVDTSRTSASSSDAYLYDNRLVGIVRNAQGLALRDVEVTLTTAGTGEIFFVNDAIDTSKDVTVRTDAEGKFAFRQIEPRNHYKIIAKHPEYTRKETSSVPVGQSGEFEEPPIILTPGALLEGVVKDETGTGVGDAALHLDGMMYQSSPYVAPDRMTTKSTKDGHFSFSNVPRGPRTLTVSVGGFGTVMINGLNFDKEETVHRDVVLKIAEQIHGKVIGPSATGLPNIMVMAVGVSGTQQTSRSQVTTNDRGEFAFDDLNPGDYNVIANGKGYRSERALRVKTNTGNVVIQMFKEATVCGQVVDAVTNEPLPSFTCRMRFYYGPGVPTSPSELQANFTSPKGEFCLEGVGQSDYVVEAQAPGYAPSFSSNFTVAQGKTVPSVLIHMTRGGSFSGRIVDSEGKPVARARITTHDNTWTDDAFTQALGFAFPTNATAADVRTTEDGRFIVSGLTPELYQINVEAAGFTRFVKTDIQVTEGIEQKLGDLGMQRGGSLRGTLFDQAGKALVGGTIHMRATDGTVPNTYDAKSGVDGKFAIANIAPGRYMVTASRSSGNETNPFEQLLDNKGSEKPVLISDGATTTQDLNLSGE